MKNICLIKPSIAIAMLFTLMTASCNCIKDKSDNLGYVDPNMGGVGLILQPTRPTVHLPNQMIRMYPVRKDYLDDQIKYFPLTLISHRLGELFGIMPFTDDFRSKNPASSWDEQLETTTPYYYSTWLEDSDVTTEFVPGAKTGTFRFTYSEVGDRNILLKIVNEGEWIISEGNSVKGIENFSDMKAYVYGEFDQEYSLLHPDAVNNAGGKALKFSESGRTLEFRYAISFIDETQAERNFRLEFADATFESMKKDAMEKWGKVLDQINVIGGSEDRKKVFYTSLYRCYERMIDITEEGRYYSNYDGQVHTAERSFYVDDWAWDTYLAHHPLRAILNPRMESDMMESYALMFEQSGWMPTFPVLWGDHACMNGFHSSITVLDNYRKGIRNYNVELVYRGMKKNSLEATMLPWRNGQMCILDSMYHVHGFYPALSPDETETVPQVHPFEKRQAVAITLGHSYDDWALSQMAKELGKDDDYKYFLEKSYNYKNLYWTEKGFFMPRDSKGEWIDIDPKFDGGMGGRDYYDENNGWTYLWQVQHDLGGLIELMGGKDKFEARLDQLFREGLDRSKYETWAKFPDFTGIVGQYSMGNEPSFHIPYLYNLTESPWKSQKKIRMLLDAWFHDNIFGIPGDEDGGGMSAFVVFSSMGFYPLVPGIPVYTIGSPVFDEVSIKLPNGKAFRVVADGNPEENKYIQQAWLNGKPLEVPWFTHEELIKGGVLKLRMGAYPNKEWGLTVNMTAPWNVN